MFQLIVELTNRGTVQMSSITEGSQADLGSLVCELFRYYPHGYRSQTSKISRLLIGPARLPLLTVVVMSPAAAAGIKNHLCEEHAGQMY